MFHRWFKCPVLEKIVLFPTEKKDSLQQILLYLNKLVDHPFLKVSYDYSSDT